MVSIKAMPNVPYFASQTFLQKSLIINLQMLHKMKTSMQYFFQDTHSFPVDISTTKKPMPFYTKTMKLWAKAFKFAVAISFQFNDFG